MPCTSLRILDGRKASRFNHGRRYGVGLLVEEDLGLPGLYFWWGKPRLITSRSHPGLVVIPKALAIAHLSVVATPLVILAPPLSGFRLLAPYCYTPLPGWHPTAPRRLAPYCYSRAGSKPLVVVGSHPLCPVAPLATPPSPIVGFPQLRPVVVLHSLCDFRQHLGSI